MSHTPGPWHWEYPDYGDHQACEKSAHRRSGNHFSLGHDMGGGAGLCVLCSAPYGNCDGDAHEPNADDAALIAAAPDLLAALRTIVANSDESNEWDAVDKLHDNRATAEAAIAKAEDR